MVRSRLVLPAIVLAVLLGAGAYGLGGGGLQLADGTYTGMGEYTQYGWLQLAIVVKGGRLYTVKMLQYPYDMGSSRKINKRALPILVQEAVQAQSSKVDIVSGATVTSAAFSRSLASALRLAGKG